MRVTTTLNITRYVNKSMDMGTEYGFCFQQTDDLGKLFVYDEDRSLEFAMIMRFLTCPDISTVYVIILQGSVKHMSEDTDRCVIEKVCDIMDNIIPTLFPTYNRVVPFTEDDFISNRDAFLSKLRDTAYVLSSVFPYNVVNTILHNDVPSWARYKHTTTDDVHNDMCFEDFLQEQSFESLIYEYNSGEYIRMSINIVE